MFVANSKPVLDATSEIAKRFLHARAEASVLPQFPGTLPANLHAAYAVQDRAIALLNQPIVGWKVGFIAPSMRDVSNDERVIGPIFADLLQRFDAPITGLAAAPARAFAEFAVIPGGFAAIEAEFVFKLSHDVPSDFDCGDDPNNDRFLALIENLHVGVEFAGSPYPDINVVGPIAVASDFGNNSGLVVGPAIPLWLSTDAAILRACSVINGKVVGAQSADQVPGTPLRALHFAVRKLIARGYALPAGTWIATGAVTGIHAVRVGDHAQLCFQAPGFEFEFECAIVARSNRGAHAQT